MEKSQKLVLKVLFLGIFVCSVTACSSKKDNKSDISTSVIIQKESIVPTEWPEDKLVTQTPTVGTDGQDLEQYSFEEETVQINLEDKDLEKTEEEKSKEKIMQQDENSKENNEEILKDRKKDGQEKIQEESKQKDINWGKKNQKGKNSEENQIENEQKEQENAEFGSVVSPDKKEVVDMTVVENLRPMPAASIVKVITANAATLAACFYYEEIIPEIYSRMEYKSYTEESAISLDDLRYVRILHYGFDGEIYIGELIVNRLIAKDIVDIFKELFDAQYPIERMVLVDEYNAESNKSRADNNTFGFNYQSEEDNILNPSKHSLGLAIDINPLYNPYVDFNDKERVILPKEGENYTNREAECEYYILKDDICYQAFISRGFTWGGDEEGAKSYQHFEKTFKQYEKIFK